jgi:lambda family phage portal protein
MNAIDRLVAWLAPEAGLRRAQARIAAANLRAMYDGARNTRRTRGWRADSTGPDTETRSGQVTLRDRARDLVRNNPFARAGLDLCVAYQVGTGIVGRSATGDDGLDKVVDALWSAWCDEADVTGRLDFCGMQALAARSRAEAGEALVLLVSRPPADARRSRSGLPLALQLVEPDQLDETYDDVGTGGNRIVQGVELDTKQQPVRYHLLTYHPGEQGMLGMAYGQRQAYAASQVLHLYRQDRPGQVRGVSDLAAVISRIRSLDELEDAALEQAKIQACLAAFVTSGAGGAKGPLEGKDEAGNARKTFAPGMIERLFPGEDVKFAMPSGAGAFNDLARHQLHAIATGWGLTYDLLTGDLSQANYSSLRAGRLAFKRRLEQLQWTILIPGMCQPVWDAFIQAAIGVGKLDPRAEGYPVEWAPPRFEMVDPLKDTQAIVAQIRSGLMTWPQGVAEFGGDPRKQVKGIRNANAELDENGLILDCDPRRVSLAGGAQDPKQLAAIEIAATGAATPQQPQQ